MAFDPTSLPTTIDALHLLLLVLALFFLFRPFSKGGNSSASLEQPEGRTEKGQGASESVATPLRTAPPEAALQLLALLQQEGRFIDFLQEDLKGFSDADIGAAARVIHGGGQKVLADYFSLSPVREEAESSRITLNEGFDASEIRLTGNVVGRPPFNGVLIHRGWRATAVKLPQLAPGHDPSILAPAEVEL